MDFTDRAVIVTGGTRGIGLATARAFLEKGARVIIFGSREETVQKALESLGDEKDALERAEHAKGLKTRARGSEIAGYWPKLTDFIEVESVVQEIRRKFGRIDVLVNNAGVAANQKLEQTTSEEFQRVVDLNLQAVFNMCKAVVPVMKEQGSETAEQGPSTTEQGSAEFARRFDTGVILNTSSMVSIYGQPSGVAYPASKAAINGLTKSLARELAPFGIRVNAVAPGVINTDMVANLPDEMIEPLIKSIPLGRMGESEDIANAFLFLASELASYITGVVLQVDGAAMN